MNEQEPMNTQQLVAEGLYTDGSPENQPLTLSDFLLDVAREMYDIACAQGEVEKANEMFTNGMNNFFAEVAEAMGLAISNATQPDVALKAFVRELENCVVHYVETKGEREEALAREIAAASAAPTTPH